MMFALQSRNTRRQALPWVARLLAAGAVVAMSVSGGAAMAAEADYPNKPIRLVNPYPPGSPVEMLGRLVSEQLHKEWGQPVLVESRAGAGGTIGTAYVAKAPADGYTLLVSVPTPLTVAPWTFKTLPYDPTQDVRPVWGVESGGLVMVVNNAFPAKTLAEFLEYAKANPGKVDYGSAGTGSPQHLAAELFMLKSETSLNHVPFQGAAPALVNLMGGHVDVMFDSITNVLPHIQDGKLTALALLRPARAPMLPEVPTIAEAGVPGAEAPGSVGIFAPKGIPAEVLTKLEQTLARLMEQPAMVERLLQTGMSDQFLAGEQYAERVRQERELFGTIAKAAGIDPQ